MDDIILNVTDNIRLSGDDLPLLTDDPGILMPSEVTTIPGPAGPPGKDGKDGQAATITVGTTTTGAAGTNASVQNVGTSSAAILDFTIPRGATGQQGQAATITVGTTTTGEAGSDAIVQNVGTLNDAILDFTIPTGNDGAAATITVGSVTTVAPEYPATVTNSGTSSAAILDFSIPQGQPGEPGADGQDGAPGADGQAATITVGTTTTGNAGTNASVTNSGTSSAAVLDFVIPRGADGAPGQDGADGQDGAPGQAATITVGTTTTGNAGTNASVTNSGTSSAAVLNFVIPRGADGAPGQDGADGADGAPGADGQAATITVGSTMTGNAGTNASVTNSGTSSAAVLNFVIPRGDTGATGAQGPAGADAIVRTTSDGTRTGVYFSDGTLICYREYTGTVGITTSVGSLYYATVDVNLSLAPTTDTDFVSQPSVSVTTYPTATQYFWQGANQNGAPALSNNRWVIPSGSIRLFRATSLATVNYGISIIAIGKWK